MDFFFTAFSHWRETIAVIVVLGGLIFFHELGHFLMARVLKVGVRTFSLGFGPKLLKHRYGKTEYCLSAVPLGGYVALAGEENPEEKKEKEESPEESAFDPDEPVFTPEEEFFRRPAWNRLLVVLAGPVANFVLALILYWIIAFSQGQAYLLPEVGKLQEEGPAQIAGILEGDVVQNINGKPIQEWNEIPLAMSKSHGEPVNVVVLRDGINHTFLITPRQGAVTDLFGEKQQRWLLGISVNTTKIATRPLGFFQALRAGVEETWDKTILTWESMVKLVQRVIPLDNVGGPIAIAQVIGEQTERGIIPVLLIAALISINLGILNLLPVPVLDGGHIMFCLIEMLPGIRVSPRLHTVSNYVGMAMLIALMVFATWNDLTRLFS